MKFLVRTLGLIFILTNLMIAQTSPAHTAPDEQVFASPILVVNTSFLNIRTGPSANFSVLTTVVGGTELPVLGTAGDEVWYQVSTAAGIGWVNITFTIPRGDFTNVPLVTVTTQPTTQTIPTIVDVPSATAAGSVAAPPATTTATTATSFAAAQVNVNAYQFPTFASNVVVTLFGENSDVFYPVVGDASDGTTLFVALDIPGAGVGWVEASKLRIEQRGTTATGTTPPAAPITTAPGISEQGGGPSGEIVVAPEAIFTANIAVVNTSFLNVRSGPGAQFTAIFTARGGSQYNVAGISSDGVWFLVQGPFGQGWVNNQFVLFRGVIETVPIIRNAGGTIATPIVVIGNAVQLYAGPGANFGLLGSVAGPVEAEIVARDTDFEWIQINTSAGFGWVLASQVTLRGDSSLIPVVAG